MVISISKQLGLLMFSFFAGIITGVLFDFYRIIRGSYNSLNFIKVIEDILFWIFTSIVVFIFLLYNDYAFIGMYVYLWIGIGLYFYLMCISKYIKTFLKGIIDYSLKLIRIFKNIVLYFFKYLIYKIKKI